MPDTKELMKKYGSPLFVYDGDMILKRYQDLYEYIKWPKLKIFYAIKANSNPDILRMLKDNGARVDTVSPGEVFLALKLGYTPDRILFTANNMTDEEMRYVKNTGVLMNIDSVSRLQKYGRAFPGSKVCLRFNPDVIAGFDKKVQTGGDLSKFGILLDDLEKVKRIVKQYDLSVVGLHEHSGSGIAEKEQVYMSMKNLLKIAKKEHFPALRFIDFGGGFKVPYSPDEKRIDYNIFGAKITEIFADFCKEYGKDLDMYFEPGKFIVAEAGRLLVEVNTVRNNHGHRIAGTNSGFPHLIRPVLYGAYHHILNLSNPEGNTYQYDVAGNICESGDLFAEQRILPEIREGDILEIQNAGAYCYAMGGNYNLRPMPAEVFIFKGKDRLSTKALSVEELVDRII